MKDAIIDLEVIENEEENPLDEIMSTVERYSLISKDFELKDHIEKKILHIERILQDFSETKSESDIYLQKTVNELLMEYSISFFQKETKDNFELFNKSLDSIIQFSSKAKFNEVKYIEQNSKILSPFKYLKSKGYKRANINLFKQAATIALTHFDITNSNWVYNAEIKGFDEEHKLLDTWDIELFFDTPSNESHKPLEFLYQFIEILNSINGVTIKIEDISLGSLTAKLKVLYETVKSKEEVKELLESSMKFAKGKLEKDFEETEKIKKETEKLELEKKLLIQEIENNDSIENAYKKSLEIQSAEEDLKRKRIENDLLKLELMQKGSVALAELLARGIISQKEFTMSIKGLPFLSIEKGKLSQGENIDIIDKL